MKVVIAFVLCLMAHAALADEPRLVVRSFEIATDPNLIPHRDAIFLPLADSVQVANGLVKWPDSTVLAYTPPPRDWRTNQIQDPKNARKSMRERMVEHRQIPDSAEAAIVTVEVNRRAEEDATARNALLDTSRNADGDGRVFFNLVAVAPQKVWTVRTSDGARWILTQTGSLRDRWDFNNPRESWQHLKDSLAIADSAYARVVKTWDRYYTLARNDSVVQRFTTSSDEPPDLVTAFAWGDSTVVEYIGNSGHHAIVNGVDLQRERGYEGCFDFQILAGKPFYFFCREGRCGWYFNGNEFDEGYQQIIHDYCCGVSHLNPIVRPQYFRAYAQRGATWYLLDGRVEEK